MQLKWLTRDISGKTISFVLSYLIIAPGIFVIALLTGTWWLATPLELPRTLWSAVVSLVVLMALSYETGYKKYYQVGEPRFFYIVFVIPLVLSALSFFYGFLR